MITTLIFCSGMWVLGMSQNVLTVSEDNRWITDYHDYTTNKTEIRVYSFTSRDTTFFNKNYKELVYYQPHEESKIYPTRSYFRQENQRLYKYNGSEQDILLIDFEAETGDTLLVETPGYQSKPLYIVYKDTTTLLDGTKRTKINFVCLPEDSEPLPQPSDTGWSFVEGIGQVGYLFMSDVACTASDPLWTRTIRCYYENNNLIWRADGVFDCLSSQTSDVLSDEVFLFPNPTFDVIQISSSIKYEYYEIYTATGQKILYGKNNLEDQIEVSKLPQGSYFLLLYSNTGQIMNERFRKF